MQLNPTDVQHLLSILNAAKLANIDALLITDGKVRGVNEDRSAALLTNDNAPVVGDLKLGLSRLKVLQDRINLFAGEGLKIELKANSKKDVTQIELSKKGGKATFRATASSIFTGKVPDSINFTPAREVVITKDELDQINKARKTIDGKFLVINFKPKNVVAIELTDSNQETVTIELENPANVLGDLDSQVFYYSADLFLKLVKELGDPATLVIDEIGSFKVDVEGQEIFVIANVDQA